MKRRPARACPDCGVLDTNLWSHHEDRVLNAKAFARRILRQLREEKAAARRERARLNAVVMNARGALLDGDPKAALAVLEAESFPF